MRVNGTKGHHQIKIALMVVFQVLAVDLIRAHAVKIIKVLRVVKIQAFRVQALNRNQMHIHPINKSIVQ